MQHPLSDAKCIFGNPAGYKLFFNERDSDVSIKVDHDGDKWHFPAHKLVLCTMSEVFRTMMEADMIEKNTKIVTIKDCKPYTVKQFLKYLYMGVVDFNDWTEAMELLKISHKYGVQTLINLCEAFLVTNIGFFNTCLLHEISRTYSLNQLKKETREFILNTGFIVSTTDGFFNLNPKSLEFFISNPLFNMENEGTILTCLREWAVCECSRKGKYLTKINILATMEPFLKYIQWDFIPENERTFVPKKLVEKSRTDCLLGRKKFYVSPVLQYHMTYVKFVLELGAFQENKPFMEGPLNCVRFSVNNHIFLAGFRMVGLFRSYFNLMAGPALMILSRDDSKISTQFNLNSLPWTTGAPSGNNVWREMIAFLPYPIRVDPFHIYALHLKTSIQNKRFHFAKWPKTRLDSEFLSTQLGTIHFRSHAPSFGITQLFMLPAPPYRNVCNNDD